MAQCDGGKSCGKKEDCESIRHKIESNEIYLLAAATADAETCCQRETATVSRCNASKVFPDKIYKSVQPKGENVTGMTCECGVFGAIACGEYPTNVSVEY